MPKRPPTEYMGGVAPSGFVIHDAGWAIIIIVIVSIVVAVGYLIIAA